MAVFICVLIVNIDNSLSPGTYTELNNHLFNGQSTQLNLATLTVLASATQTLLPPFDFV